MLPLCTQRQNIIQGGLRSEHDCIQPCSQKHSRVQEISRLRSWRDKEALDTTEAAPSSVNDPCYEQDIILNPIHKHPHHSQERSKEL